MGPRRTIPGRARAPALVGEQPSGCAPPTRSRGTRSRCLTRRGSYACSPYEQGSSGRTASDRLDAVVSARDSVFLATCWRPESQNLAWLSQIRHSRVGLRNRRSEVRILSGALRLSGDHAHLQRLRLSQRRCLSVARKLGSILGQFPGALVAHLDRETGTAQETLASTSTFPPGRGRSQDGPGLRRAGYGALPW
jgi:hypothetical protein